ncbi:MAG: hypothetical protein M1822_006453 [Bathelium mastoideum]|nr:MAG: hypothetical protein M1822_006453 [Bathelium mastoideum]
MFHQCLVALSSGALDPTNGACNNTYHNLDTILQALDIDELVSEDQDFLDDTIALLKYTAESQEQIEDIEDYLPLQSSYLTVLRNGQICREVTDINSLHLVLRIFKDVSKRAENLRSDTSDAEHKAQLEASSNELLMVLCEMAISTNLPYLLERDPESLKIVRDWLSDEDQTPQACFICATLFFGNLAEEDSVCERLVHEYQLHKLMIQRLRTSTDLRLLHAAGGCLRNLAVSQKNKEVIATAGAFEAILHLLQINVVHELPYLGACITRQLINGSFANIQRFTSKPDPAIQADPETPPYLNVLLQLSSRSDDFATKAEVARTVAALFRTLSGAQLPQHEVDDLRRNILSRANLLSPVEAMIRQDQNRPLRSEAWFALALTAQSHEGANIVAKFLEADDLFELLREQIKIVENDSRKGKHEPQDRMNEDRENGFVLLSSLLQKTRGPDGDCMPESQRKKLEYLLREHNVRPD